MRTSRRRSALALVLAVAVVTSGCARSTGDDAFARLGILDPNADWRDRPDASFVLAQDGQELDVGQDVRTDAQGFAEVEYADGSLTRLDASTVFRVVELSGTAAAPEVTVSLDRGRVWNKVREVTGQQGRFEVETAVGVAAVRGTAFTVACDEGGPCSFAVHSGRVEVTRPDGSVVSVDEGEAVELDRGGDVRELDGALGGEPGGGWPDRNQQLDLATDRFGALQGTCSATLAGQNVARATTPQRAVVVGIEDAAAIGAAATGDVTSYQVALRAGPFAVPAARDDLEPPDDRWTGGVVVADYAFIGVGLYAVRATTEGTECRLDAFVRVVGRSPMTTVLGLAGLLLLLLGLAGLAANVRARRRALRRPELPRDGHRVRGALSGAAAGLGGMLLLQQYGYVPLADPSFAAVAAAVATLGIALGWPRDAVPTHTPPPEPSPDPH